MEVEQVLGSQVARQNAALEGLGDEHYFNLLQNALKKRIETGHAETWGLLESMAHKLGHELTLKPCVVR